MIAWLIRCWSSGCQVFSSGWQALIKWMVSSAYLRLLIFLSAILIPACASSSPAFLNVTPHVTSPSRLPECWLTLLINGACLYCVSAGWTACFDPSGNMRVRRVYSALQSCTAVEGFNARDKLCVVQELEAPWLIHLASGLWEKSLTAGNSSDCVLGERLSDFIFHFSLSCIGEGNGNPLQYSCLENPMDRGAWRAAVYRVAQSQTRLKWLSSSYIVVHTLNVPNLSILLLLDVGAVYSSLLLRISFTCICFMSWMGINEA